MVTVTLMMTKIINIFKEGFLADYVSEIDVSDDFFHPDMPDLTKMEDSISEYKDDVHSFMFILSR